MEPLQIFPIQGIREITEGSSIPDEILCCAPTLADGDVLVIASKIISKAEGRVYRESDLEISPFAAHLQNLPATPPLTANWCCGKAPVSCALPKGL